MRSSDSPLMDFGVCPCGRDATGPHGRCSSIDCKAPSLTESELNALMDKHRRWLEQAEQPTRLAEHQRRVEIAAKFIVSASREYPYSHHVASRLITWVEMGCKGKP